MEQVIDEVMGLELTAANIDMVQLAPCFFSDACSYVPPD